MSVNKIVSIKLKDPVDKSTHESLLDFKRRLHFAKETTGTKISCAWIPYLEDALTHKDAVAFTSIWKSTDICCCADIIDIDIDSKTIFINIYDDYAWINNNNESIIARPRVYTYGDPINLRKCCGRENTLEYATSYCEIITFDLEIRKEVYFIPIRSHIENILAKLVDAYDDYTKELVKHKVFWGEWSSSVGVRVDKWESDSGAAILKVDISDRVGIVTGADLFNGTVNVETTNDSFITMMDQGANIVAIPRVICTRTTGKIIKLIAFDFKVLS